MLKLILAIALQLNTTHARTDKHYTLADLKADNPYTLKDWEKRSNMPAYTTKDFDKALNATLVCQCFTVKVSPVGNVVGRSRACACDE